MSMQIKSIILYNKNGDIRELKFRTGALNIITGISDTGKSAIIPIIEYCMGQSDFEVPSGVIRDTVVWYSVLYQVNETEVLVAKPAPSQGARSQSQVYFQVASRINIPKLEDLSPNSNDDAVTEALSGLIGIASNKTVEGRGKAADPFEATIRHTSYYLFQQNDVVASKNILFHKQTATEWAPRTIRSTLPYFLGAIQEDRLQIESRLLDIRRKVRSAKRQLAEIESVASDRLDRGRALFAEAKEVGLLPPDLSADTEELLLGFLRRTQSWKSGDIIDEPIDIALVEKLQGETEIARQSLKQKQDQIQAATKFAKQSDGFSSEANHQIMRLDAIGVFTGDSDTNHCPLCSSELSQPIPTISQITLSLSQLKKSLGSVSKERPRIGEYIRALEDDAEKLKESIRQRKIEIEAIQAKSDNNQEIQDQNAKLAKVVGRISFYLENLELTKETQPLLEEIDKQEKVIEFLENQTDSISVDEKQSSILNLIGFWMTEWAKKLSLEYSSDFAYRFDPNNLTVIADLPTQTIPMISMGGSHNILGCHLSVLLAFHKYFVRQKRPVPSFLVIDQPAQVFFVSEADYKALDENPGSMVSHNDRVLIAQLFELLGEACEELSPDFQIIVLEHANLDNDQFKNAMIEPAWVDGRALIPQSWYMDQEQ